MSVKRYLGDGVYADFNSWAVVLTTENGIRATNTIVLEDEVIRELERFIADLRKAAAEAREAERKDGI